MANSVPTPTLSQAYPLPFFDLEAAVLSTDLSDEELDQWYNRRQEAVRQLNEYEPFDNDVDDTAQWLLVFLDYLSKKGQTYLARDVIWVVATYGREKLYRLRNFMVSGLMRPVVKRANKSGVDSPVDEDAESEVDRLMGEVEPCDRSSQSRLKAQALRRDGYKCVVTEQWDYDYGEANFSRCPGARTPTELCHIIPQHLGHFDENVGESTLRIARIWYCIWRYYPELSGVMGPDKLNDLENVVTLDRAVHHAFDKHLLFFKSSNHPNRYRVESHDFGILGSLSGIQLPRDIVLRQYDARYPLPRKVCLDWHYRISRVFKTMKGPGRDRNKPNVETINSPSEDE